MSRPIIEVLLWDAYVLGNFYDAESGGFISNNLLNDFTDRISARLTSCSSPSPTVLLQGLPDFIVCSIIQAAWHRGMRIAIVRPEMPLEHLTHVGSLIGSHLHIYRDKNANLKVAEFTGATRDFDDWLNDESGTFRDAPDFDWDEETTAAILFTSGSTGIPKGVCHSQGNILRSAQLFIKHFGIDENERLCCLAQPHTMSGFRSLILPLSSAMTVAILPPQLNEPFLQLIERIRVNTPTLILCGPIFINHLAHYGKRLQHQLQGVYTLLCTGAQLNEEDRTQVQDIHKIPVLNYYGLTETAGIVMAETLDHQVVNGLPPLCDGVHILLEVTPDSNTTYQLSIQSPNLFLGYLGEGKPARKALFQTGDLVKQRPDGELAFVGHAKSAFKAFNTEWVYPEILEHWLKQQTQIRDATIHITETERGSSMEATIDCSPDEFDTIRRILPERIDHSLGLGYRPSKWRCASIQRTELGKIDQVIVQSST